jgi:glycosyltransferase involved in cell wall biosynthesis
VIILIIQGKASSRLVSGEKVSIENDIRYLERNHEVFFEDIELTNSGVHSISSRIGGITWSFRNYIKIQELISKHNPDIVHFHTITPYLSLSTVFSAYKMGVPIVQTLHNVRWLCLEGGFFRGNTYCDDCISSYGFLGVSRGCGHGRIVSFLLFLNNYSARKLGFLFKHVDRFIAVSDFVKRVHVQSNFPENLISVRNNSIDLIDISHSIDREGVTFAGRVSVAKGALLIKKIIPSINEKINIVGNGPYLEDLKFFCTQNNFKNVIFWGKQTHEKTVEIIKTSICTVVPSQCGETFSLVAAESMAAGIPVVASNLGGVADLVNQSGGGLTVNHNDYKEFSNSINELLHNVKIANALGSKGVSYATKYLSHERQGEALIGIYNTVIEKYKK